ncbi:hypothetical protein HRW23_35555 [Streptomyces lunaelactis]|uniref:hypothetical protein n=1 Tax=Streptomyces lunaelactis TaxID=1535768 RepID=UPI001584554B|nr:hypothetical protein [Streptomyces lunaelactis]NUK00021.1 hypothetical protein [Streptomyces lunaelactis]NUK06983.1 hypothetical protein [Streptomyces lunaelactis]NUK14344.1 hypothetical protein [Streptomyces lunaelactis]NUK21238.1 hypothetical protein [Streptomyces lunaelactis]NUK32699.1 hypothetical protein [Streptomyces lunaelactis]
MSSLSTLLHTGAELAGAAGVLYTVSVTVVASASVFSRSPERRRDARQTLAILMCRRAR